MIEIDKNIPGWSSEETTYSLGWLANKVPPGGRIVEIGVLWGRISKALLANKQRGTKVICIDPCIDIQYMFPFGGQTRVQNPSWVNSYCEDNSNRVSLYEILSRSNCLDDVEVLQKSSRDVVIDYPVDLAVIDGSHVNGDPLLDLEMFVEQKNCLIAMDDVFLNYPDLDEAMKLAHTKFGRSIFIPPRHHWMFILPLDGPMLPVMYQFMQVVSQQNENDSISMLRNA